MRFSQKVWGAIAGACLTLSVLAMDREAQAQVQVPVLSQSLLQFEAAVTWSAMSSAQQWAARRSGWIAQVRGAASPQQVAALALEFETAMGWNAMNPAWRQQRPGWVASCHAAGSDGAVARALLALENATLWSAVNGSWRGTRPGWVARMSAVAGG
jgi:hypothetical protein